MSDLSVCNLLYSVSDLSVYNLLLVYHIRMGLYLLPIVHNSHLQRQYLMFELYCKLLHKVNHIHLIVVQSQPHSFETKVRPCQAHNTVQEVALSQLVCQAINFSAQASSLNPPFHNPVLGNFAQSEEMRTIV